jgi:DnaJ-class molecular chaperone
MVCPTCNGRGKVDPLIHHVGGEVRWTEDCGTCKGTGEAAEGSVRDIDQLFPERWPDDGPDGSP